MGNLYTGTSGADTLQETTLKGDTLVGGAGNDTYYARAGSYYVPGFPEYGIPGHTEYYRTKVVEQSGGGTDTVHYGIGIHGITVGTTELANIERIYLVNLFGGTQDIGFRLQLGSGAQTVFGSNGHETLDGGAGNDTLDGGAGNDSLVGGAGTDSLRGGAGHDTLVGNAGADRMAGGTGGDSYYVISASDVVVELAGEGADTVYSSITYTLGANVENLVLGAGAIGATGNTGNNTLVAGTGNNRLAGGAGVDTASFKDGAVSGSGVNASLITGVVSGGSGSDTLVSIENLEGSIFQDSLFGNAGNNRLVGLAGNDSLDGGAGADTMVGGNGADAYVVNRVGDVVDESTATDQGGDHVFSSISYTLPSAVEHLTLTTAANLNGVGNAGNNRLTGNAGDNRLNGGAGTDNLLGGAGNDTLTGGDGYDEFTGGSGADNFRFNTVSSATSGSVRDLIVDFVSGEDRIDLSGIDADPTVAGDQAFTIDQLSYDAGTGLLAANVGNDSFWDVQIRLGILTHPPTVLVADLIL